MKIKEILKDSTAIICGRIDSKENTVEKMKGLLEYNNEVLQACHSVVLVLNRGSDVSESEMTEIGNAYKSKFKISYILQPHPIGMGHQIGHVALDKTGYLFSKHNLLTKYTIKLCNDISIHPSFLDFDVEPSDFYFLPSIGSHELINDWKTMLSEYEKTKNYSNILFNYQTWFWIATNNTDLIYEDDEEIERLFRLWDHKNDIKQSKLLCAEHSLAKWSIKNNIKRFSLYNRDQLDNYRNFILNNRIADGSLKNISIEHLGITHYHFTNQDVIRCFL
jgi:hypothetical protein